MRPVELQGVTFSFDVCLAPQYLPSEEALKAMGSLETLMHAAYLNQDACAEEPAEPASG